MSKRTSLTIVECVIIAGPGFEEVVLKLNKQIELLGQSKSTQKKLY